MVADDEDDESDDDSDDDSDYGDDGGDNNGTGGGGGGGQHDAERALVGVVRLQDLAPLSSCARLARKAASHDAEKWAARQHLVVAAAALEHLRDTTQKNGRRANTKLSRWLFSAARKHLGVISRARRCCSPAIFPDVFREPLPST